VWSEVRDGVLARERPNASWAEQVICATGCEKEFLRK
jgi:hypothetical protein